MVPQDVSGIYLHGGYFQIFYADSFYWGFKKEYFFRKKSFFTFSFPLYLDTDHLVDSNLCT